MNYSELKTAVADYMHRTDLTAKIPGFIQLAESFLFRELDVKALRVSVAGVTTGEYVTLPADFLSVVRLTSSHNGREYDLDYASQPYKYALSYPANYALENNKLRIFGASTGQAYTLYYAPKIAALSDSNTSNWILENAQDLYLYASAIEAARWTKDEGEQMRLAAMLPSLLDGIKRFSERKGQPTNGSLQIKPRH